MIWEHLFSLFSVLINPDSWFCSWGKIVAKMILHSWTFHWPVSGAKKWLILSRTQMWLWQYFITVFLCNYSGSTEIKLSIINIINKISGLIWSKKCTWRKIFDIWWTFKCIILQIIADNSTEKETVQKWVFNNWYSPL